MTIDQIRALTKKPGKQAVDGLVRGGIVCSHYLYDAAGGNMALVRRALRKYGRRISHEWPTENMYEN